MSLVEFPDKDSPLILYGVDVCGRNAAIVARYERSDGPELARACVHFSVEVRVTTTVAAYSGDDHTRALLVGEAVRGCLARAQRVATDPQALAAAEAVLTERPRPFGALASAILAGAREAPRA